VVSSRSEDQEDKMLDVGRVRSAENSAHLEPRSNQAARRMVNSRIPKFQTLTETPVTQRSTVRRQKSSDTAKLERDRDRESVRELAAFLKTRDPPPDNYMSIPESVETTSQIKKLPFKVFHRQNSKRQQSPSPRPLRLPDSAVAAKTTSGKWHIAISIPLEHDCVTKPEPRPVSLPQLTRSAVDVGARTSPIIVLKPVIEGQELVQTLRPHTIAGARGVSMHLPARRASASSPQPLGTETAQTLMNYYRHQSMQDLANKRDSSISTISQSAALHRESMTIFPDLSRRFSTRTDPRHSGGTAYSEASLITDASQSMKRDSVSSAPSSYHVPSLNALESASFSPITGKKRDDPFVDTSGSLKPPSSPSASSHRLSSFVPPPSFRNSVDSDISAVQVGKSDATPSHGSSEGTGAQFNAVRKVARTPGPAPNRKLPDLPEGSDDGLSSRAQSIKCAGTMRSNRSSLNRSAVAEVSARIPTSVPSTPGTCSDGEKSPRQIRQDKVKALRSRDMAALKAKTNYQQAMSANLAKGNRVDPQSKSPKSMKSNSTITPPRYGKVRSTSPSISEKENGQRGHEYELSPVMLVANIEPSYGHFYFPVPPNPHRKVKSSNANGNSHSRAHTPPRSLTPSLASSDDDAVHLPRLTSTSRPLKEQSSTRSADFANREELEARLKRVEKSNVMMLQTLNAVVRMEVGLKALEKLLPLATLKEATEPSSEHFEFAEVESGEEPEGSAGSEGEVQEEKGRGMDAIEPLMRELQLGARLSQEINHEVGDEIEREEGSW
jgi:hypothetical protein